MDILPNVLFEEFCAFGWRRPRSSRWSSADKHSLSTQVGKGGGVRKKLQTRLDFALICVTGWTGKQRAITLLGPDTNCLSIWS